MTLAWRAHLKVHLDDLDNRLAELRAAPAASAQHVERAATALQRARSAVDTSPTPWSGWTGAHVEQAWPNAHAAEVALLRLTPVDRLKPMLTSTLARSELLLLKRDARVKQLRERAHAAGALNTDDRELAAETLAAAFRASEDEHVRVRSFRNVLLASTFVMMLLAVLVGSIGALSPSAIPLCNAPRCLTGGDGPSGGDVFAIELLGLVAAAITAAIAIRRMRGTSTPYAVPLASQLVKLPIGALTAVGGLLLARGGFFPALNHLSAAEARAYALVFGASQQLFMQLVDRQAQTVLNSVKTGGRDPANRRRRRRS